MATHGCTGIPCTICGAGSGVADREPFRDAETEQLRLELAQSDQIRGELVTAAVEAAGVTVRALDEIIELTRVFESASAWREGRQHPADAPEHASERALLDSVDAYRSRIAGRS